MLSIPIEATELFNELTGEFVTLKPVTLKLEHSLISISKWEAKWHKPFSNSEKTAEEMRDYIRCMTLNGDNGVILTTRRWVDKSLWKFGYYIRITAGSIISYRVDKQIYGFIRGR